MPVNNREREEEEEERQVQTMPIYTHTFSPSGIHLHHHHLTPRFPKPSISTTHYCVCSKDFSISSFWFLHCSSETSFNGELRFPTKGLWSSSSKVVFCAAERRNSLLSKSNRIPNNCLHRQSIRTVVCSASDGRSSGVETESSEFTRKRKVVEHICMLKAKGNLSDEDEKVMLDYLYTSQYQMRGIIAISLGRISDENPDGYTHAVFMRFQRREDLAKFYENSFYLRVLKEHVTPYCHGLISVDYESEVEDDILPIFRKGEEFNFGVEFVLLISVVESALGGAIEDALASLAKLTLEFPSLIVQSTQGSNFNCSSIEYTHGAVIRFRSLDAFNIFVGSSEYKDMWKSKFQPITQKTSAIHYSVDPVGTEIM